MLDDIDKCESNVIYIEIMELTVDRYWNSLAIQGTYPSPHEDHEHDWNELYRGLVFFDDVNGFQHLVILR